MHYQNACCWWGTSSLRSASLWSVYAIGSSVASCSSLSFPHFENSFETKDGLGDASTLKLILEVGDGHLFLNHCNRSKTGAASLELTKLVACAPEFKKKSVKNSL